MTDQRLVSVIIPMFNAEMFIKETIASVNAQTYSNVEIVVVDDGSTDDSYGLVEQAALESRFPITLLTQVNSGVSASRNRGVAVSKGDSIAFLDADDLWAPTKLADQVAALSMNPRGAGVLCGYTQFESTTNRVVSEVVPSGAVQFIRDWLSLRGPGPLLPSTLLMDRRMWDEINGFDERLSTAADADFGFRLVKKGSLLIIPAPLVHYRLSEGQMHRNPMTLARDYEVILRAPYMKSDKRLRAETRTNLRLHISLKNWQSNPTLTSFFRLSTVCLLHPLRATGRALQSLRDRKREFDLETSETIV